MIKLSLFIFILLSLFACAPQAPKTELKVSIGAISGSSNFPGGLIISGRNQTGAKFVKKVAANDELLIELPNGSWDFSVIGWDGTEYFEGDSYCAIQAGVDLAGTEISLNLTATKTNCVNPVYGMDKDGTLLATATNGLNTISVNSCLNIKQYFIEEGPDAAPANLDCSGANSEMPLPGDIQSVKIMVPEIINGEFNPLNGITSKCYDLTSTTVDTNIRLPYGSPNARLPIAVLGFDSAGCSGNQTSYEYPFGLNNIANDNKAGATPDSVNSRIFVNLHSDACTLVQRNNSPFAVSAGTKHLICTASQFEAIGSGSTGSDTFEIAADIEFPSSNATITTAFSGVIEGNNHVLSNGDSPLFDSISGSTEVKIQDLIIDSFTLNITNNSGILANSLAPSATTKFEIRNLKVTSSSILASSGSNLYIGGLIGIITPVAGSKIYIENNNINVDIDAGSYGSVGGLIGKYNGVASAETILRNNQVGSPLQRVNLTAFQAYATAFSQTGGSGGIVGQSTMDFEIFNNRAFINFDGRSNIGGIIGYHNGGTKLSINDSFADINYDHLSDTNLTQNIGGLIGRISSSNLDIRNTNSKIIFSSDYQTASTLPNANNQYIGGLVGLSDTASNSIRVQNVKSNFDIETNGDSVGGFFGSLTSSGLTTPHISDSTAQGKITSYNSLQGTHSFRGGFVGNSSYLNISKSISISEIEGSQSIGGVSGAQMTSKGLILIDIYLKNKLTSFLNDGLRLGAITGRLALATGNSLKNIFIDTEFNHAATSTCFQNHATIDCGSLIGRAEFDYGSQIADVVANISENYTVGSNSPSSLSTDISSYTTQTSPGVKFSLATSCSTYSPDFNDFEIDPVTLNCLPKFYTSWVKAGAFKDQNGNFQFDVEGNVKLRQGNNLDPFEINTVSNWNSIGNNPSLLNKTYKLMADLDFQNNPSNFTPIGGAVDPGLNQIPFRGGIISNGFKLKNIKYIVSSVSNVDSFGVIHAIDGGFVGRMNEPLIIEGLEIDNSVTPKGNVGFIGYANNSHLNVIVKNANYYTSAAISAFGGIIGRADGRIQIRNSGFSGKILAANSNGVGSIVGVHENTANTTIESTFAKISQLTSATMLGGFVGHKAGSILSIMDSYLDVDVHELNSFADNGNDLDSASLAGFVGGSGSGSFEVKNSFVNLTNSDLVANIDIIGPVNGSSSEYFEDVVILNPNSLTLASLPSGVSQVTTTSALMSNIDEFTFAQDINGKPRLYWEVNGFENY